MPVLLWTVVAVAAPTQSDSGRLRVMQLYAYGLDQAWAWAQRHYSRYADVVLVY